MCVAIVMVIKLVLVTTVSSVQKKKHEKAFKMFSPNATDGIVGSAAPGVMVRLQV
jgi:hypothetical protein